MHYQLNIRIKDAAPVIKKGFKLMESSSNHMLCGLVENQFEWTAT